MISLNGEQISDDDIRSPLLVPNLFDGKSLGQDYDELHKCYQQKYLEYCVLKEKSLYVLTYGNRQSR